VPGRDAVAQHRGPAHHRLPRHLPGGQPLRRYPDPVRVPPRERPARGWNDQPQTMAGVLEAGRDADAIVFTGYYHKPENAAYLRAQGVPLPYGEHDYVWTHGLGEQRRYAIQHTLRYQIWELDQPHYLRSHGSAAHGHASDPGQAAYLTTLRDQLTAQTRYTDDY